MGVGGLHELLLDEEKLEVDEEMHYVTMLYDAQQGSGEEKS